MDQHLMMVLTLIPSIAAITWAAMTRLCAHQRRNAMLLGVAGAFNTLFVLANYLHMCSIGNAMVVMIMQMLTEASLLPSAYMYMTRHESRRHSNHTRWLLWALVPFVLLPKCIILMGDSHAIFRASNIQLFTVNIFYGINNCHSIYTSDAVMFLQVVLTLRHVLRIAKRQWHNRSLFSRQTLPFGIWILLATIFITFEISLNTNSIMDPILGWIFFGGYSFLITTIFTLLAISKDYQDKVHK